jgi:hypothetical protein
VSERLGQLRTLDLGYRDLQHQQRDRDREHAVGESLQPAGVVLVVTCLVQTVNPA